MDDASSALRKRIAFGVTSMSSSVPTYPIALSRSITFGGVNRIVSSLPLARIFVNFFSFVGLTSRSFSRVCSPMIIPAYTSDAGPTKSVPRGSSAPSEYVVVTPDVVLISLPFFALPIAPHEGPYESNARCMTPLPRVALMNSCRKPMRPRLGT